MPVMHKHDNWGPWKKFSDKWEQRKCKESGCNAYEERPIKKS